MENFCRLIRSQVKENFWSRRVGVSVWVQLLCWFKLVWHQWNYIQLKLAKALACSTMSTKMASIETYSNAEKLFSTISLRSNFLRASWAEVRKMLIDRYHSDRGDLKISKAKKKDVNSYAPCLRNPDQSRKSHARPLWAEELKVGYILLLWTECSTCCIFLWVQGMD